MSAEDFIDTNVFVYLFDETDAKKRQRADSLIYRSLENRSGCISYQVIQETMNGSSVSSVFTPRESGSCSTTS